MQIEEVFSPELDAFISVRHEDGVWSLSHGPWDDLEADTLDGLIDKFIDRIADEALTTKEQS